MRSEKNKEKDPLREGRGSLLFRPPFSDDAPPLPLFISPEERDAAGPKKEISNDVIEMSDGNEDFLNPFLRKSKKNKDLEIENALSKNFKPKPTTGSANDFSNAPIGIPDFLRGGVNGESEEELMRKFFGAVSSRGPPFLVKFRLLPSLFGEEVDDDVLATGDDDDDVGEVSENETDSFDYYYFEDSTTENSVKDNENQIDGGDPLSHEEQLKNGKESATEPEVIFNDPPVFEEAVEDVQEGRRFEEEEEEASEEENPDKHLVTTTPKTTPTTTAQVTELTERAIIVAKSPKAENLGKIDAGFVESLIENSVDINLDLPVEEEIILAVPTTTTEEPEFIARDFVAAEDEDIDRELFVQASLSKIGRHHDEGEEAEIELEIVKESSEEDSDVGERSLEQVQQNFNRPRASRIAQNNVEDFIDRKSPFAKGAESLNRRFR